ncbi:TIGR03643 family protein [Limnohabitans sp.]|uniref:TIGR03643 family protein n=1 Tax=Limnohabitans sp. TaxID=1907725 RepID=UPI0038B8B472
MRGFIQRYDQALFLPSTPVMTVKFSQRLSRLSAGDISAVIQMAWEDRTSFETIQERVGLSESDVIGLMRHELSPRSFRLWRMRVKGRITKHRALRSPEMKYEDRWVANHRRANC